MDSILGRSRGHRMSDQGDGKSRPRVRSRRNEINKLIIKTVKINVEPSARRMNTQIIIYIARQV